MDEERFAGAGAELTTALAWKQTPVRLPLVAHCDSEATLGNRARSSSGAGTSPAPVKTTPAAKQA
jgi:hypothetical protein